MESADKDSITQLFIKLGNMPEKADVDMSMIETLVKQVYYRNVRNSDTTSLNQLRKYQFMSTTSNDVRKIAPSSDALYMHSLRAAYTSGYLWAECCHVSLPDPLFWGYIWKDEMFVLDWLQNHNSVELDDSFSKSKSRTARSTSCIYAKLNMPCLPLCLVIVTVTIYE